MQFIETPNQYEQLECALNSDESFFVHLFVENLTSHPIDSTPMLLMLKNVRTHNSYAVSFSHPDCINISSKILLKIAKSKCRKLILNKKDVSHIVEFNNSIDIALHTYYRNKTKVDIEVPRCKSIKSVPIMSLLKVFNDTFETLNLNLHDEQTNNLINDLSGVLGKLETSRIFSKTQNKLIFTQYNMFTPTTRPSNRYNNINFLALNKKQGDRSDYVSRYGNDGAMVMVDYESYHLRLFANHINYKLPHDSLHTYLGKLYHGKKTLTDEEYELSKKITFNLIFGGITKDIIDNVPFMRAIHEYVMEVKKFYEKNRYVETWIYNRKIHCDIFESKPNEYKVFNYLLQAAETERNCRVLSNILSYINDTQIKLPLYTYDAFLFDMHKSEFDKIKDIINIMDTDKQFPVKLYVGSSYNDLSEIHV
jgi:hypothetical protein